MVFYYQILHLNLVKSNLICFSITGFEGQYAELTKKSHTLTYPSELVIYSFPKGNLSDYPPPPRDEVGTPGEI